MAKVALIKADVSHEEVAAPSPPPRFSLERKRMRLQSRLITIVVVVAALWWAQAFFIPVTMSLLISCALEPLVVRLENWRVPRQLAVPVVLFALLAALGGGLYALRGEAVAFADRLPEGARTVARALRVRSSTPGTFARIQQAAKELEAAALVNRQARPADGVTPVRIEDTTLRWNAWLWQGSYNVVVIGAQMIAVICLVYYLLMAGDLFRRRIVRIVGPSLSDKKLTVQILWEVDRQIERFLMARAVISGVVAVAVWAAFSLLGIEQAGIWALIAGVLFTVPLVGPAIVIVGAALAGALQSGSPGLALAASGACTFIAVVEGNVLQPWLMSRVGEMNAVAVFISLLFWGFLWGPWGLLLAVPITAAIEAVCERIDDLSPCAEILKA